MSTHLVDAIVLIALLVLDHEHHTAAESWAGGLAEEDLNASDPVVERSLHPLCSADRAPRRPGAIRAAPRP